MKDWLGKNQGGLKMSREKDLSELAEAVQASSGEVTKAAKGMRLRYIRELAKLKRQALAEICQVSYATYKDWENGKGNLPRIRAYWIADEVASFGVNCSVEWLMTGKDAFPTANRGSKIREGDVDTFIDELSRIYGLHDTTKDYNEAQHITAELDFFMRSNPNTISAFVCDHSMLPFYHAGDVVAGMAYMGRSIKHFVGKNCIVELVGGKTLFRRIMPGTKSGLFNLACMNTKVTNIELVQNDVHIKRAAPIIWHRQRLLRPMDKTA